MADEITKISNVENTKKADVLCKYVPYKKTRMTIEGESNLVPVMPLLALRFGRYNVHI